MKHVLLFAAFVLIFISCKETVPDKKTVLAEFTPFNRAPLVLNGKVKSYKMRTYWATEKDGKIEKGEIITRAERDSLDFMSDYNLELNVDGLTTRWEYIMYDGEINYTEPEIAEKGIVGGKWFINGEYRTYYKEEYDDSGKRVKEYIYRYGADTLMSRSEVIYLENGRKDQVFLYNHNNELTRKQKFIWKDSDLVSEFLQYNGEDELIYSMKVEYDENGHFISATYDYPDVRLTKYEIKDIKLDDLGNIISAITYKNDTLFCVFYYLIEYYQD